ncbi:gamma-glutamylcyclotransferase [Falsiruegeria mediterranea]
MPFSDHTFRYTPALRGKITPPDQSEMRFGLDRFDELDLQAIEEGWPTGWRMDHEKREANRQAVLAGRLDQDLWVFAYGSLIWDPAVQVDEYRYGSLPGWHRRFCMRLDGGRGTHDQPGLMAALDQGGHCDGVVFRIPSSLADQETQFMWRREMFSGSYQPVFLEVDTPQGVVEALVFLMDTTNNRYLPDVSLETSAQMIAVAEGNLGPNFTYLESLVRHLDELGLEDPEIRKLHARASEIRTSLFQFSK